MESYVPSNQAINEVMDNAQEALEETKRQEQGKLNETGNEIINRTEKLIFDARRLVNEKNSNDLIQQIIHEGTEVYQDIQQNREQWRKLQKAFGEFDSEALQKKMENMSKTSKLIAIELISSAKFRQSVYDFFTVLASVLVDITHLDRVGKPLREALDEATKVVTRKRRSSKKKAVAGAAEKLKEAGGEAVTLGLDMMDPDKPIVKLSSEQKDSLIEKFRDILRDFSKRERTQAIINGLFDILDLVGRPIAHLTEQAADAAGDVADDKHFNRMLCLTQQLFEAFTRHSLDPLLSHVKVLYLAIKEDEEMKKYFDDLKTFLIRTLEHPERIGSSAVRDEIDSLIDRGQALSNEKKGLRYNFLVMRDEVNKMIYSMEQDPMTIAIQEDIKHLVEMVLLDSKGKVTFKPEVLEQLKIIALSALVKRLRFPLPPITFDDNENLKFTVTGLMMGIQDILPNRIIAENHGIAILDMKEIESGPTVSRAAEAVRVKMENINVHMPEADIWFHKRSFPSVQDSGKATIDIGGSGMDLIFVLKAAMGSDRLFVLEKVECFIHSLDLKLEQTHHDMMYNAVISIFKGFIKRNIEDAIQESLANVFEQLTDQVEKQVVQLRSKMQDTLGPH